MRQVLPIASGTRFGLLSVIALHPERSPGGQRQYACRCDCGSTTIVLAQSLNRGVTRSCGCLRRRVVHGHTARDGPSPTYNSWATMKQRCTNAKTPTWNDYGGRGVAVCERWNSFVNFLADMGERPEETSLDRIDPDGNYEPGNCRWATNLQQAFNQRRRTERTGTHCIHNHEFTAENTYTPPSKPTARYCRTCRQEAANAHRIKSMTPCHRCGGPKPSIHGRRLCESCRLARLRERGR